MTDVRLEEQDLYCPYCGEPIQILVDCSIPDQAYVEDCQVCCRPIHFHVTVAPDGLIGLQARHEDE